MQLSDYGINAPGSGQVKTTCPQCSATRRKSGEKCLSVNVDEGVWNCKHCGWAGSLKGKTHRPIIYKKQPITDKAEIYFKKRAIPKEIYEDENIGYDCTNGKNWITFPYEKDGRVVNIKYRSSSKEFRQEKNAEKCLYRYDKINKSQSKTLVITEGEIDTLSCLAVGYESTSIPDGAPQPEAKNLEKKFDFLKGTRELFDKFEKIIIATDNDDPGKLAGLELGRRIGYERCWTIEFPNDCKDPNDILQKYGENQLARTLNNAKPWPIEGILAPLDIQDEVISLYNHGIDQGVSTGWKSLDRHYTIRPGEMTIITGIPSSGKSNFLDDMILNVIGEKSWRFGFFSPENWPVRRHLSTMLEKYHKKPFSSKNYTPDMMTEQEVKAGTKVLNEFIRFIVPKEDELSVDVILKYARILCLQYGIKGLVIDPWNEVEHSYKGLSEAQYLSRELTKIRRFARLNGVHVWVVAHPKNLVKNNSGTYDPPTMYEISGGATWRNKADNGICVHRDYDKNKTSIIVQKIRFRDVGEIGEIQLEFTYTGNYKETRDYNNTY